ncbi:Protein mahjong [Pseudolycoriella hygida]|uniref:Protein mahjong n=1 Tax=Pseudolycoriella hygida TaxID=35572 RepID=A0A9Q0S6N0_9DIPT|nr:Protein mahjong [Pseudolycoriella hygida]
MYIIAVGMVGGKVKLYNSKNGNECITHHCHENNVRYVKCSKNGTLLLTSSFHTRPVGKMWNIEQNQFSMMLHFAGDEYLEFSNLTEDKIVGTKAANGAGTARINCEVLTPKCHLRNRKQNETYIRTLDGYNYSTIKIENVGRTIFDLSVNKNGSEIALRVTIYDIHTGQAITTFQSPLGNSCRRNVATFSPSDDLILSDGVLWDVRSGEEVHRFDMSNQIFSGVFHPNALEIVSDDKVWDMRTLRLLRTVPELEGATVKFSPQNVIYAVGSETRYLLGISPIRTLAFVCESFKTLDGYNYSTIKIKNVGGKICGLSVNKNGCEIALVENWQAESVLCLYSVGTEEEDDEDNTGDRRNNDRHSIDERYFDNNDEN